MSVSKLARAGRIDSAASDLNKKASDLNSKLNAVASEVLLFAGMMHQNSRTEFEQEDKDKYSANFVATLSAIQATMARFEPLMGVETGAITPEAFVATLDATQLSEYVNGFDSGS